CPLVRRRLREAKSPGFHAVYRTFRGGDSGTSARVTRSVPLLFEPRRQFAEPRKTRTTRKKLAPKPEGESASLRGATAGAQGFEPCRAALETACSPRSTLLSW